MPQNNNQKLIQTLLEQSNSAAIPTAHKESERNRRFYWLTFSLALETSFAYLQYTTSYIGWSSEIPEEHAAVIIAVIGTLCDYVVNISTISPRNDATYLALLELADSDATPSQKKFRQAINLISDASYLIGGSGNVLGILALMSPLYKKNPALYLALSSAVTIPVSWAGLEYYRAFNEKRRRDSEMAAKKAYSMGLKKWDWDLFRASAVIIESLCVILFRSLSFGGISILVLQAFHADSPYIDLTVGLTTTLLTAINIIATRFKTIADDWLDYRFAQLTVNDKQSAWKMMSWRETVNTIFTLKTFATIIMAAGIPLVAELKNNLATMLSSTILGICLIGIFAMAQLRKAIALKAIQLNQSDNKVVLISSVANTVAITESQENRFAAIEDLVNKSFEKLTAHYQESAPLLVWLIFFLCIASVTTRGLGFLGFVDVLNSILEAVVEVNLSTTALQGFALIIAPFNIENMFKMFYSNMCEIVFGKIAEYKVRQETASKQNSGFYPTIVGQYNLYTKGKCDFSKEQIHEAVYKIPSVAITSQV